jgi:anthranilate synthase component 1
LVSAALTEAWYFANLIESFDEIARPGDLRQLHRAHPTRYPFLLQSTARGGALGRFDVLFLSPGDELVLQSSGELLGPGVTAGEGFLAALDRCWSKEKTARSQNTLPFLGGWFLYLGYELAAEIEPALNLQHDPVLPVAFAVRCTAALIYDHQEACCFLVRETADSANLSRVKADAYQLRAASNSKVRMITSVQEEEPGRFIDAVAKAQSHIAAGDVYQANLSRGWVAEIEDDVCGSDIYASLCDENPAPFAGIAYWHGKEIISSSPERLLEIRNSIACTRPIAGTRPRSADSEHDSSLSSELFAHPKELAEHVMLIDLERNDLGRICTAGSVEVDEMMVLESYAHVHHIVSNVRGQLRDDVTPGQAIAAVFPGGTITGCPKVRCMEIIADLEDGPRGAYTGSFGYLNRDGSLDLNILIRTMVKQASELTLRAGAGIVADSDATAELEETRAKAKGMLRALGPGQSG